MRVEVTRLLIDYQGNREGTCRSYSYLREGQVWLDLVPSMDYCMVSFEDEVHFVLKTDKELVEFSSDEELLAHQRVHMAGRIAARAEYLERRLRWAQETYPIGSPVPGIIALSETANGSTGSLKNGVFFNTHLNGGHGRGAAYVNILAEDGFVRGHEIDDWLGFSHPD